MRGNSKKEMVLCAGQILLERGERNEEKKKKEKSKKKEVKIKKNEMKIKKGQSCHVWEEREGARGANGTSEEEKR